MTWREAPGEFLRTAPDPPHTAGKTPLACVADQLDQCPEERWAPGRGCPAAMAEMAYPSLWRFGGPLRSRPRPRGTRCRSGRALSAEARGPCHPARCHQRVPHGTARWSWQSTPSRGPPRSSPPHPMRSNTAKKRKRHQEAAASRTWAFEPRQSMPPGSRCRWAG